LRALEEANAGADVVNALIVTFLKHGDPSDP
jgi:hypothetical protein